MTPSPETTALAETVKDTATSARILTLLKENRIELIGCVIIAHLLGVSDRVLGHLSGVCF
jgi:hypothetical protein